jgi:transcriptional regulator with XRE-family HTH domain
VAAAANRPLAKVLSSLGAQLKALRSQREWTLEQLSKSTKLSEPYLSRLESGARQPSLAALITLARAYGLPVRALLDSEARSRSLCAIVRAGGPDLREANGLRYRAVSGSGELNTLQAIQVTVSPNRRDNGFNQHDGEEWIYVLAGRLKLIFEGEQQLLRPGDSAHFDARIPHRLAAVGNRAAELLLVAAASGPPSTAFHADEHH